MILGVHGADYISSEWKCWKNADGVVTTIRRHLKGTHSEEYERVCKLFNLKHSDKPTDTMMDKSAASELFNLEEWLRRLVKWIVVDDQVQYFSSDFISLVQLLTTNLVYQCHLMSRISGLYCLRPPQHQRGRSTTPYETYQAHLHSVRARAPALKTVLSS